jgi:hypothetical protein
MPTRKLPRSVALCCLLLLLSIGTKAQVVSLYFPHFTGHQWTLITFQGNKQDTILTGTIPLSGEVALGIPNSHQHYRGMARWMLAGGGGLDFILNGESFSAECLSAQPDESTIFFTGSVENTYFLAKNRALETIYERYVPLNQLLGLYPEGTGLHRPLGQEQRLLQEEFARILDDLAGSTLYAARLLKIVQYTRGIGRSLDMGSERAIATEANTFLRYEVDFSALFTSGHWGGVLYDWVQMHTQVLGTDTLMLASAINMLDRMDDPVIYTDFCEQLARQLLKAGKDSMIAALTPAVRNSGRLNRSDGVLCAFYAPEPGSMAPELIGPEGPIAPFGASGKPTILLFYQSACGPCADNLNWLMATYESMSAKGIRVITISADRERRAFDALAASFNWPESICDQKGFDGPNFKAYGVAGTPTVIGVDAEGRVIGRFAGQEAVKKMVEVAGVF